mmetsp:Transcript_57748/g.172357  ORF Transcript_57748/g.172357 Transcript_57748/m.172357 type:complete len:342 (-) Transcript_57748:731-1756(-)
MRFYPASTVVSAVCLSLLCSPSYSTEAFHQNGSPAFSPRRHVTPSAASELRAATTATAVDVPTSPIAGMRPGTSGLRKKVEVWQAVDEENKNYVENFIQSLLDTAVASNGGKMLDTIIVAGDGRYFNAEAIQTICRVLAGNGVANIWIPQGGIMSTPAVSAVIRRREGGKAQGGIVLTASHNPGGPGEDFGIKYNEGLGQPAGEEFTEALYERSLELSSYKTLEGGDDIDLSAPAGTTYELTSSSTVTIIDQFDCYLDALKDSFDFDKLREFAKREGFSLLYDGMHGAGGPFARRVFIEELGLPEVRQIVMILLISSRLFIWNSAAYLQYFHWVHVASFVQ